MSQKLLCTLSILVLYLAALNCQNAQNSNNTLPNGTSTGPLNQTSNFTTASAPNGTNSTNAGTNASSNSNGTNATVGAPTGTNGTIIIPNGANTTINGTNETVIFVNGTNGTLGGPLNGTNGTNGSNVTNVTGNPGTIGNNNTLNNTNGNSNGTNVGANNGSNVGANNGSNVGANNGSSTGVVIGGPTNANGSVAANGPANNTNITCNLTSSTCNQTGVAGVNLTITCVNITTCPNQTMTQTCVTSYCPCSNSVGVLPGSNNANNSLCQCMNCTYQVSYSNGTTNITENATYTFSNFTANTSASAVYASMQNAWNNVILNDVSQYWNQPWADPRTASLFGVFPGDPNYQIISRDLVNDWGSVYSPFQCSSLFCNGKGYCTIGPINNTNNVTNNTQSVGSAAGISQFPSNTTKTPVCTCISGWLGKRCVFPDVDYNYGLNWTNGIGSWLNAAIANGTLNTSDPATFTALAGIAGLLPQFSSQVMSNDVAAVSNVQKTLMNALYNSSVNLSDPNIQNSVSNLVNNLTLVNDTLLGVNPVDTLMRLGTLNGTNATNYIFYATPANLSGDTVLALPSGSPMRQRRGLLQRMLQSMLSIFNLNTASPDATVPQNVSTNINNSINNATQNFSYAFAAVRNPKPMMTSVENYINSQIVGERIYLNGNPRNGFNYTTNATNITNSNNNNTWLRIDLPWAYTPFVMRSGASYLNNCQVFRWDGLNNFVPTNSCVLLNSTDQNKAVLNCQSFDIIGVGCTNQTTTTVKTSANTNTGGFNGANGGASSNSLRISFTCFFVALLMFVF